MGLSYDLSAIVPFDADIQSVRPAYRQRPDAFNVAQSITVASGFFEVMLRLSVTVITSAVPGNRVLSLQFADTAGLSFVRSYAVAAQAPSTQVYYQFDETFAQPFTSQNSILSPLPAVAMYAQMAWILNLDNGDQTDHWLGLAFQTLQIPSGKEPTEPLASVSTQTIQEVQSL